MQDKASKPLNLTHFACATAVPILVMPAAMMFKPIWRDEYWSLYFAYVS